MKPEASKESVMPQRSHKDYDFFNVVQDYLDRAATAVNLDR